MSAARFRRATGADADAARAIITRSMGHWPWSTDEYAVGFYLAMGGQVTGSTPSGIEGDEPLTEMALRID